MCMYCEQWKTTETEKHFHRLYEAMPRLDPRYIDGVLTALKVIVLDSHIRQYLMENDPKALEQAENAILA